MFPEVWGEARAVVWPRLYGVAHVELDRLELELGGRGSGVEAVRAVAPGVVLGVVVDEGTQEVRVSEAVAAGWGVSFDAVLEMAVRNAETRRFRVEEVTPGVRLVRDPVFVAGVWVSEVLRSQLGLRGALVGVGLLRDYLLIGVDGVEALTVMAGVAGDMLRAGEALESVTPCRLVGQGWVAVDWGSSGVREDLVGVARGLFADQCYGRQKTLLEQQCGGEWFVPELRVYRGPDGRVGSVTTWTEGVPSLLPVADRVDLVGEDLGRASLGWGELAAVPGLMVPCGLVPERYRVSGFPPAELLAAA